MEAGKAVQIGRGPATVIGFQAVSQATLPSPGNTRAFREKKRRSGPIAARMGLFCCLPKNLAAAVKEELCRSSRQSLRC
jgi:hypothetical protein